MVDASHRGRGIYESSEGISPKHALMIGMIACGLYLACDFPFVEEDA